MAAHFYKNGHQLACAWLCEYFDVYYVREVCLACVSLTSLMLPHLFYSYWSSQQLKDKNSKTKTFHTPFSFRQPIVAPACSQTHQKLSPNWQEQSFLVNFDPFHDCSLFFFFFSVTIQSDCPWTINVLWIQFCIQLMIIVLYIISSKVS